MRSFLRMEASRHCWARMIADCLRKNAPPLHLLHDRDFPVLNAGQDISRRLSNERKKMYERSYPESRIFEEASYNMSGVIAFIQGLIVLFALSIIPGL